MKNYVYITAILLCNIIHPQNEDYDGQISELTEKMWDHYYYERDSAYFYVEMINKFALKKKDTINQIEALLHSNGIASYHYDLQKTEKVLDKLEKLLGAIHNKSTSQYFTDQNMLLYYKGAYFLKLYEYKACRNAFEKIIQNVAKTPDSLMNSTLEELASVSLSFIGKTYLEEGKFGLAKQFYNKDIRALKASSTENLEALYDNYNLLAEVYRLEEKYKEANNYLLKTYKFNKEKNNSNSSITTAFNIAQNYNQLGLKDSALHYLSEAKGLFNDNPIFYSKYHLVKAEIHTQNKKPDLALFELDKAIEKIKENVGESKNINIAVARNEMGNLLTAKGEYLKAIENYDLGLQEVSKIKTNSAYNIKLLKNKSICLNTIKNDSSYLAASRIVDLGIMKLDSLKPSLKNHADKLVLIEDAFPLFESGMKASYSLYESSQNSHYIDEAFQYAEKSKSALLLEAVLASKATTFANIPEEVTAQERQLKSKIAYIEKEIDRANGDKTVLEDELFQLNQQHRNLVVDIESNYPSYFDLKYNSEVPFLPELQEELMDDELFISYFYGSNTIYTIAIAKHQKHFETITISPELESDIIKLHAMLSNPRSDIDSLSNLSYSLYQKLLAPILKIYHHEKIIIVPDGLLNYIPFGSLVSNLEQNRFLVQDRAISYTNSANLWSQLSSKEQSENRLLAFAPSFDSKTPSDDKRSKVLDNLPHNKKEVGKILNSFMGTSFTGNQATLQNFTSTISDYTIFHLATHAVFDDENPEYSYLAFTPDSDSEDLLFVKDLYNLTLKAGLVTLSACESGIGELKRGEGFLSLARGFFYSGASSISSTLWKVNDNSSSELMGIFYENLADGKSKDKALQHAKLSFLEKNRENGLSHPYHWSGYIVQGNSHALVKNASWRWWYFAGGILLIFIFLGRKSLLQVFK